MTTNPHQPITDAMSKYVIRLPVQGSFDLSNARDTYLIYPWIREGENLTRILRLGSSGQLVVKATVSQEGNVHAPNLSATLSSERPLSKPMCEMVGDVLSKCLNLSGVSGEIARYAEQDKVLAAAIAHRGYGRGKLYPDLFEAICGVVCAQRMAFHRVYGMMEQLAVRFGPSIHIDGHRYWAFPRPDEVMLHSEEEIRSCGLGYRARYILGIARAMGGAENTYEEWCNSGEDALRERLIGLPGIGAYTANLVMSVAYGSSKEPHFDSYVKSLVSTFYFDGQEISDHDLEAFVRRRWGRISERVLDLLTTDTEIWARMIGFELKVRSGSRAGQ